MVYRPPTPEGLKPKDLIGVPWRVAFALQEDGWYLRSEIIWHKTNPQPETVTDRPTRNHEHLYLLSKESRYYYDAEAIKEQNFTPIVSPKIEVIAASEGQDFQFRAQTCEKPEVKLGNYREAVAKLRKEKHGKIWVPGKDEREEKPQEPNLEEILKALLEESQVNIPVILIEDEVNRMLSRLIDQTQKLGLTVEQYLASQGKTTEDLRAQFREQARANLALEFVLEAIADQEKIEVNDEDVEKVIKEAKDPKEQEALRNQKYYLAAILRKQKVLDRLSKPIV